jgi:hypothetical protein
MNACPLQKSLGVFVVERGMLVRQPSLGRERVSGSRMTLRAPSAEAGLNQILPDGLPMRRHAARDIDMQQNEGTDVVKCPKHASAVRCIVIHSYRFKYNFGQ